jgi:hypothetical protein
MLLALTFFSLSLSPPPQPQQENPIVSCSVKPDTIAPGADVTITAQGMSAQNRKMSYSFTATSGRITVSSATTAVLHTAADSPATITVTCHVVDDRGAEAKKAATVTVSRQ